MLSKAAHFGVPICYALADIPKKLIPDKPVIVGGNSQKMSSSGMGPPHD
jgi:hypothetical protein